jgi:hypothetical protein
MNETIHPKKIVGTTLIALNLRNIAHDVAPIACIEKQSNDTVTIHLGSD